MSRAFTMAQIIRIKTEAMCAALKIVGDYRPTPEELRMKHGLTLTELARETKTTPTMLRKFERGEGQNDLTRAHFEAMQRIAKELNVTESDYAAAVARQREKYRDSARPAHVPEFVGSDSTSSHQQTPAMQIGILPTPAAPIKV
jgi:transcriptional regulator with XRE-family HTH domain